MRLLGRYLEVGDLQVLGESLADGGLPVGEAVAVDLGEQLAERRGGGGFVGTGTETRKDPLGSCSMWPRAVMAMAAR